MSTVLDSAAQEAVLRFLNGGDLGDVPQEAVDWYGLAEDELRACARAEHERRGGVPETVIYMREPSELDDAVVAEFYSLVIVPASEIEADAWIVWGDLHNDQDGFLAVGRIAIAPFQSEFGQRGLGHREWNALRYPQIRDAAKEAIGRIAGSHRLTEVLGVKTPLVKPEAGERAQAALAALGRSHRGNPGLPEGDHFEFATRWMLAQRAQTKLGVYAQLERHYGQGKRETIRSRAKRAVSLGFLTKGEPKKPASRRLAERFIPFWESLSDEDPLKDLARELLPREPNRKEPS